MFHVQCIHSQTFCKRSCPPPLFLFTKWRKRQSEAHTIFFFSGQGRDQVASWPEVVAQMQQNVKTPMARHFQTKQSAYKGVQSATERTWLLTKGMTNYKKSEATERAHIFCLIIRQHRFNYFFVKIMRDKVMKHFLSAVSTLINKVYQRNIQLCFLHGTRQTTRKVVLFLPWHLRNDRKLNCHPFLCLGRKTRR